MNWRCLDARDLRQSAALIARRGRRSKSPKFSLLPDSFSVLASEKYPAPRLREFAHMILILRGCFAMFAGGSAGNARNTLLAGKFDAAKGHLRSRNGTEVAARRDGPPKSRGMWEAGRSGRRQ